MRGSLEKFDLTKESDALYNFLNSHQCCITLFDAFSKGKWLIDEITSCLNKENKFDFAYEYRCKKCGWSSQETLAQSDFKQVSKSKICPNCKKDRWVLRKTIWPLDKWHVQSILIHGFEKGVFSPTQYVQCPFCSYGYQVSTQKKVSLKCPNCGKPLEIHLEFETNAVITSCLGLMDKQGYWLEWYIGNFLIRNGLKCRRNCKFVTKDGKLEVDLIYVINGENICISCDNSKEAKFDSENFHLIPRVSNSDYLILVTTQKTINPKIISAARKYFKKVKTVVFTDLLTLEKKLLT